MQSRLFIAFIALIINSYINSIMVNNNLYEKITMLELLQELEKIKILYINSKRLMSPITTLNKVILEAFDIKIMSTN
jgi:hypothetical protein